MSQFASSRSIMDENNQGAKGHVAGLGGQRRALGDIGNLVGGLGRGNSDGAEKPGADAAGESRGPRGEVKALLDNLREKAKRSTSNAGSWGATRSRTTTTRPRDFGTAGAGTAQLEAAASNVTSSRGNVILDGSNQKSITSLLLSRSEQASARKTMPPDVPDIDVADRNNPLACTTYVNDIYAYWRRVEPDTQTPADYMQDQTDINDKMRAILIDWLVEVHLKFKLMPETLFLTTNLIDRFLAKEPVSRKNLQLVGVTAMLLAAKYEEIWAPEVRDFVYISDKAYNRQQILAMEKQMLNRLDFNLTVPTPHHFLARYLKAAGADKECELLATFLTELALPEYSSLKYSSSLLSCAAVYTANKTLGRTAMPPALAYHSQYTEAQIRPCAQQLVQLHRKASSASLLAVHKKYSTTKFMEVAKRAPALSLLDGAAN